MCVIATHMYVCIPHSDPVPMEVRRVADPLELELRVSHYVAAGN